MHEELAVGREADLVARRVDLVEHDLPGVLVDLLDRILVLRILVELQEGRRIEILLRVEDADAAAQAHDSRRPAALGMPDRAVGAGQRERASPGIEPSSTNSSPIGTISQSILLPLVPR